MDNREVKEMEKTQKYSPLMRELRERERERNPGYQVKEYNIIIDDLGGYSADVSHPLKELECHYLTRDAEICHIEYTKHCTKCQNSCLNKEDCC